MPIALASIHKKLQSHWHKKACEMIDDSHLCQLWIEDWESITVICKYLYNSCNFPVERVSSLANVLSILVKSVSILMAWTLLQLNIFLLITVEKRKPSLQDLMKNMIWFYYLLCIAMVEGSWFYLLIFQHRYWQRKEKSALLFPMTQQIHSWIFFSALFN